MPMDFPDMRSLEFCAEVHKFRSLQEGETEDDYRTALANHVEPIDFIESCEIRNGVGWDKFSQKQNISMIRRSGMFAERRGDE